MKSERSGLATGDLDAVRAAVGRMRLTSWSDVEQRLLVRAARSKPQCTTSLVPAPAIPGPEVQDLVGPTLNGSGRYELALEVVLLVGGVQPTVPHVDDAPLAFVPLHGLPVDRWATSRRRIWHAAARNTRRQIRPTVTTLRVRSFQVWLLTGDRLTSAVAMDIGYFARAGADGPAQAAACTASGWWSVLSERAAVILVSDDPTDHSSAADLIAGLRRETAHPLPANLFRYDGGRSSLGPAQATAVQPL